MSLTREITSDFIYKEYIWVVMEDRNYILKIDSSTGKMVRCIQVPLLIDLQRYSEKLDINTFKLRGIGDITGYEISKKRSCLSNSKTIQAKIMLKNPLCDSPIPVELNYNVSSLAGGWHMFTLIFDQNAGTISLYVDAVLVDSASDYEDHIIYYKYFSPFLVGADSGKFQALEIENQVKNPIYFQNKIQDVKLFQGVIDPKILKGESLLSTKSDPLYLLGELKNPLFCLETINKILVNEKPYKNKRLVIESKFLNSLPPTCSQTIKNKILEENSENLTFELDF